MIPDETVERVRESADIVQVIGEHVNLRRVGTDWRGPCPFHQGTNRNFSVSPKKRMYYCFVCHEGGDVFNFLQKRLGMDWPSAVRLVAEKSGIEIREVDSRRDGPDPREPLWEVNATAAEYFQRMLWEDDLGQPARDYLADRRITREMADRHALGFAPREIGLMRSYLNTLGFDDERLLAAGILARREESDEPRPRFRGRLMFPIMDLGGRYVGFGGRVIGPGEPKYLNSAESDVFSKGKLLYGLNWAKHAIRRDERVLIVEGYFDVIRLAAAGIESVVAPLGTALTADQAALVARYTKNVFLLYDSDIAGQKATFRSGDQLLAHGLSVRVVSLPDGEDPDTFVDTHGRAALEKHLEGAVDVFDRKVQELERRGWFADLHRRRRAIDLLLPTIRAASDPLTRDIYIARTSEASGIDRGVLLREVDSSAARRASRTTSAPLRPGGPPTQEVIRMGDRRTAERRNAPERAPRGASAERELVRAMLSARARVESIAERVGPESFRDHRYGEIFSALLQLGHEATLDEIAGVLSSDALEALNALLATDPAAMSDLEKTIAGSLALLRVRELQERNQELDRLIPATVSEAEKDALTREKVQNRNEIAALNGVGASNYGKSRA